MLSFHEETAYNENAGTAADLAGNQTDVFGVLGEEIKLPDPEIEFYQHRNVGSGANLHLLHPGARTLSGSIPVTVQNGKILKYLLGACADTGSTGDYTHAITCANGKPDSMCIEALYNDGTDDFLRYYTGCVVTGASISAEEEGFLKCGLDIEAAMVTADTTQTASSVTQLETEPYIFSEGVATYFGSTYARVLDFNISVKRAFKARRYLQASNASYPYEINFGPRDIELGTTIVAADDMDNYGTKYYNELLDPSSGGSSMSLVFTRGTNDTLTLTLTGCVVRAAPHPINPSAEDSPVSLDLIATGISASVNDAIATY